MSILFNPLYCLLKDGRKMVVWSDNEEEETMSVFSLDELGAFDPEYQCYETVSYSEVLRTDRNKVVAYL